MINFAFVLRQLGLVTAVLSVSLLIVSAATLAWFGRTGSEWAGQTAMLITTAVGMVIAVALGLVTRKARVFLGLREALLLVALSWLLGAGLAAMPYWLWAHLAHVEPNHPFHALVNCYFEAMSGLTTTGATILSQIEPIEQAVVPPRGLLLWRATTHWLGGLGIVVLFVAVLPTVGVGGKKLFQLEASGPTAAVRPRIREAARMLWLIYLGLTVAQIVILRLLGMNLYDAVCHTFATLATGGFSTHNASIGHYDSTAVYVTITVFMVLAGVNFGLYYQLLRGRIQIVWKDPELRLYLALLLVATGIVTWALIGQPQASTAHQVEQPMGALTAAREAMFQVVSIHTGTGFCTSDFDKWGLVPKAVLVFLMFAGASAGSTSGGIKVIRCLVTFKVLLAEVERVFRPNVVRAVRVGQWSVEPEARLGTIAYVLGILCLAVIGTVLLLILEPGVDIATAASAAVATLNNIGPGLARVGAVENYGWFSTPSKIILCLLMALGRLEVFAIIVLFNPRFWRSV